MKETVTDKKTRIAIVKRTDVNEITNPRRTETDMSVTKDVL